MASLAKFIRFLTDFSSVSLSPYCESLSRTAKVEQWWVETSRNLCTCLSLMDLVRLKTTSVSTHQTPPMGGLPTAIITFSEPFVGPYVDRPEVIDEGCDHAATPSFGVMCRGYVPPYAGILWGCDVEAQSRRNFKRANADYFFVFHFPLFPFLFFFVFLILILSLILFSSWPFLISLWPFLTVSCLVRLSGYSCKGSTKFLIISYV